MPRSFLILISLFCFFPVVAMAERPAEEIPMYGGEHNPTVEKNTKFSEGAAQLGWKYYAAGDYPHAIRRFNQAWIFDRENPGAYWGFGLIMGQRAHEENPQANLQESARFLQMALDKSPTNGRLMGDLAFSHALLGQYAKTEGKDPKTVAAEFQLAGELFAKAYKIERYPPTIANWSILLFYTGDYTQAKNKANEANLAGYKLDPGYLKDLDLHLKR